jgi:hypothetical protein
MLQMFVKIRMFICFYIFACNFYVGKFEARTLNKYSIYFGTLDKLNFWNIILKSQYHMSQNLLHCCKGCFDFYRQYFQ